jgi:drug/metabolite transporter (DMT)-like permease
MIIFIYSPNVDIPATTRMLGDALIILAALSWASSTIFMKKAMTTTTSDSTEPLTPLQLTVWASVVGFFILTPWSAYELIDSGMPTFNQDIVLSILFLAVFSTVISYVWFAEGIQTIGANRAALYVYLVPPFGILSGWWLLGEQLGLSLIAAFVLIVGGVAIAQSEKHDESEPSGIIHGD